MTSLTLSFNEVKFNPVQQDGQIWLSAGELARALGYAKANAVTQVYDRNQDELSPNMTQIIDNPQSLNLRLRIFSLRGCHLIAMFAKTAIAKQFRKWVLDILDKEVGQPVAKTHKAEREPLTNAVNLLVAKTKHLNYSDAYKLVHQRFNVKHIDEIPFDAIPVAVEYVHHLIVLFSNQSNQLESLKPWQDQNVQFLMWYVPKLAKIIKNDIYPALTLLRSELSGQVIAITHEALCHANLLNRIALKNGMTHYTKLGGQPLHTFNGF
ncbi:BRO family protein [Acinetobacter bereziniae]|uniref:BRO-N domain-containing protein n=1 Tax=Acinetobacter bereziniae TaxID=106648 RepID=UPI002814748D|nr:BRO family protein [Acinetobacter bereziniae]MDQ9818410.1 BRO family protein [Acinetobacter bereziniae]